MKVRDSGMPEEGVWEVFFSPDAILNQLGFGSGVIDVVDFGSGYGTFSLPAAKRIQGDLYAFDIDPVMLERLRARAESAGVTNLKPLQRDICSDGTGLPDASVDYVMLFNILHCEDPVCLLREAWRILRPGGVAIAMHWRSDVLTPRGPSLAIRPRPEQIARWGSEAGFGAVSAPVTLEPFHYGLTFIK